MSDFAAYTPDAWFDDGLMVNAPRAGHHHGPNRAERRWKNRTVTGTMSLLAAGAAIVAGSLFVDPAATSGTTVIATPHELHASPSLGQRLADALQAIRRTGDDWNGSELTKPAPKSVAAAEAILAQLPEYFTEASAGVDGDGNIYFRMKQGEKLALVTIAPPTMHVVYIEPGQPNVYIDDEHFKGKVLPVRIKRLLNEKMA